MNTFVAQNWGNVASVVGLAISIWVLVVARKAREAAEAARSVARLKSFVEVIEEARGKNQRAGLLRRNQEWNMAHLLAQEVSGRCWQASTRWGDHLTRTPRSNLMEAARIAESLASFTAEAPAQQLDEGRRRRALDAQLKASTLINMVLGEAQKAEERIKE